MVMGDSDGVKLNLSDSDWRIREPFCECKQMTAFVILWERLTLSLSILTGLMKF